ncbi:MAG TPA: winged helix-turn-helix domain-containing protein [Alphaproteobacteria bacterium]|nr:winged helix-turn-helix domain-containing protein [Alphaproteobacteria bacterium]
MESTTAASCLEALGQPTRLDVFRLLVKAGEPGMPFGEIQERTGVPASTLSHHLATLARCGLITQTKQGRQNYSAVSFASVHALVDFLMAECCSLADHCHLEPAAARPQAAK